MRERPLLLQFIPHGDPSSPVVHSWHWSHLWMASHIQLLCYPQWLNILTSKKVCELLSCLCLLYQLMTLIYVPHESANTHKLAFLHVLHFLYLRCTCFHGCHAHGNRSVWLIQWIQLYYTVESIERVVGIGNYDFESSIYPFYKWMYLLMTSDKCWVKTYTSIPCGSSYL